MSRVSSTITIYRGDTLTDFFRFVDSNGVAVSLSDVNSARAKFVQSIDGTGTVYLSASSGDGSIIINAGDGIIQFNISAAITAALTFSQAYWDLELTYASGRIWTPVYGTAILQKDRTI